MPCKLPEHVADAPFGLESRYSLGLRRLAVFAAADKSYRKGSETLEEFCGFKLSYNTVRELCNEEAPKMDEWYQQSAEVQKEYIDAPGNIEITMDGTCVNTTEGAREVRVGLISKRKRGQGVLPERWGNRNREELPEIETCVAFAAVEDSGKFKKRVNDWRRRLCLGATSDISVLGDGVLKSQATRKAFLEEASHRIRFVYTPLHCS